jgi:eukaryotic-like serine/threonine-protein kinase
VTMFPYAKDYQSALRNPYRAFTYLDLQHAQFKLDLWGLPTAITGSRAVIFKATIGAGSYALRCYTTRGEASCRERYTALASYVTSQRLTENIPSFTWRDDAIRVNGATWPVLQMEWIEGQTLDQYVGYLAETSNTYALDMLAQRWRKLIDRLQRARVAHSDLQHGNVLVDHRKHLRLVDFDSVWVPLLEGQPPHEIGHKNYQHPGRTANVGWGRWADTFSALVIYLSLVVLARDPELWRLLYNGENLLFEGRDFRAPFDTEIWTHLARIAEPEIDRLSMTLRRCCAPDWVAAQSLENMLDRPTGQAR